ncbi:PREDICTED: calmodulin-binding [Prunus dulcis]|uniref:PREDICTED: calmodulin-binding n=2 Tax=Prunus dulcis TaxID=3755 RepID=A0A5E4G081_PRUDU|nr:PREDICTED: calmodulin-binding [Prunus dulcis]
MLEDEVRRLKKIGKDGAFHKKLASENINTVQDFLKLFVVDRSKLIRTQIENLVREAYANWNSLEMVDAILNETALLTQGDYVVEQYPNHHAEAMSRSAFDQNGHLGLAAADNHPKSVNVGYLSP